MELSNTTRAVDFDDVSIRSGYWTRAVQGLHESLEVTAAWGHVQVLRLECAVLRLILGVAQERVNVAGMIRRARSFVSSTVEGALDRAQLYRELSRDDH